MPLFTVLTPSYNRAHLLPRTYESLCAQTLRDFDWLVVDDGSTDDTQALVEQWVREGRIAVRYVRQPNGGKHVAVNRGVREALGELTAILDSDDTACPEALERFTHHWHAIPAEHRGEFSGCAGLCVDPQGRVVGTRFPADVFDGTLLDLLATGDYVGEKWGFHRTDVLRAHPFPEFVGERFIPEGIVWNRIARRYKLRFFNEPVRVYEVLSDSLTVRQAEIRARSPHGSMLFYRELADLAPTRAIRLRALVNLARYAKHAHESALEVLWQTGASALAPALAAAGVAFWLRDRRALRY